MLIPSEKVQALANKSPKAADELLAVLRQAHFRGVIGVAEATIWARTLALTVEQFALALVPLAERYAVAPVSGFQVGAVAVGSSGALYFGANLEIAGQPLGHTVHAEQAAIANAWTEGESGVRALAISSPPCGHCRQFLHELATAARLGILLPNRPSTTTTTKLADLLPDAFGPRDLGIEGGLMRPENHGLKVAQLLDGTAVAALAAANASYSPYTSSFAGLALRTSDGTVCTGRYAENAAYNPSLSPLGAALSQLVFRGLAFSSIVEAVLVEAGGPAAHAGAIEAALAGLCAVPLTVYKAAA